MFSWCVPAISRQEVNSQTLDDNPTGCLSHWFLTFFSVSRLYSYLCSNGKNIPVVSLNIQKGYKELRSNEALNFYFHLIKT